MKTSRVMQLAAVFTAMQLALGAASAETRDTTARMADTTKVTLGMEVEKNAHIDESRSMTPVGVSAHHRTFAVTVYGTIGDPVVFQTGPVKGEGISLIKARQCLQDALGISVNALGVSDDEVKSVLESKKAVRKHSRPDNGAPIVTSMWREGNLKITQTVFACLPDGAIESRTGREPLIAYIRLTVENSGQSEESPRLWVWRSGHPYDDKTLGSGTRVFEPVSLKDNMALGQSGNCHLIIQPAAWRVETDASQNKDKLQAFAVLTTKLAAGQKAGFDLIHPFWPATPAELAGMKLMTFDEAMKTVVDRWTVLLDKGVRFTLPDNDMQTAFHANIVNTMLMTKRVPQGLIVHDGVSLLDPANKNYNKGKPHVGWMNETIRLGYYCLSYDDTYQKVVVHGMLQNGFPRYARELLEGLLAAQGRLAPKGAAGKEGCLSAGQVTAQSGGDQWLCGQRCTWESGTGYSLWACAEYYRYTKDAQWVRDHRKELMAAIEWIRNERKRPDIDESHRGMVKGMGTCDGGGTGCDPYNDIMSYWGMKSIGAVLKELGLDDGVIVKEADEYGDRIKAVYKPMEPGLYGLVAGCAMMSGLYDFESEDGKRLSAAGGHGWYGIYSSLFRVMRDTRGGLGRQAGALSQGTFTPVEWPISCPFIITHGQVEFLFMVRTKLFYEDDKAIHLVRGIPAWWLGDKEKPIEVKNAVTTGGALGFTVHREGADIAVDMDCPKGLAKPVRIHLPMTIASIAKAEGCKAELDATVGVVTVKECSTKASVIVHLVSGK